MIVIGFAGFSGAGKTTLITSVIPMLVAGGVRPTVIKHAHHGFDVDRPGKDSHRYREAGAGEVLVASARRWALMHELRDQAEPTLDDLIARLSPCQLLLVEGFKRAPIDKIEVWRAVSGHPMLWPEDGNIVAVASDVPIDAPRPRLDINRPDQVADFILARYRAAAG